MHHRKLRGENAWVFFLCVQAQVFLMVHWCDGFRCLKVLTLTWKPCFVFVPVFKKKAHIIQQRWRTFLWYVSNFSTVKLNQSNLYTSTVISKTWQLLKGHLSGTASFHVSLANYCTLSTQRHFWNNKNIRDSGLISKPSIQLAEGLC